MTTDKMVVKDINCTVSDREVEMKGRKIIGQAIIVAVITLLSTGAFAQDSGLMDKYLDKYWGKKRDVKVIQKRLFQKDGRHEINIFGGTIPNDEFQLYFPFGLRYDYFFSEDLGIEVFGEYIVPTESDLAAFLADPDDGFGIAIKTHLPQKLVWTAGLEGLWSPIHGKIGMFTSKLFHFDVHLALGVGAIGTDVRTRDIGKLAAGEASRKHKVDVAANIGLGARLYFLDWLAMRIEYRHFFYAADPEGGGGLSYPAELTLGASFFL